MFYIQRNRYHTERILYSQNRKTYSEAMSSVYLVDVYITFFGHIFFSFVQVLGNLLSNSRFEEII